MKKYKKYVSNKMFYRKYKAKVVIETPLANDIVKARGWNELDKIAAKLINLLSKNPIKDEYKYKSDFNNYFYGHSSNTLLITKKDIETCSTIMQLLQEEKNLVQYGYNSNIIIFTNMVDEWKKLLDKESNKNNKIWELCPDAEKLLENNENICIVTRPPEYEFKIYLKEGFSDPSLANFLQAHTDGFKVGDITLDNIKSNYYLNGNYFYAKNRKYLTLLQLSYGACSRRIDRMVYKYEGPTISV